MSSQYRALYSHCSGDLISLSLFLYLDPRWNLTEQDEFDFMTTVINITRGRISEVDETLQGLRPFRKWETIDIDKRLDRYIDFVEGMIVPMTLMY